MPDRFTEEEARRIFARAAERQHADEAEPPGLSRAELEEIGRAAGLDPAALAAAIAEVRSGSPDRAPAVVWGVDVEPRATRVVPRVTDEAWEQIVARLRQTFKTNGTPTDVGRVREWAGSSAQGLSNLRAVIEPVDGGSQVTLEMSQAREAKAFYALPIMFGVMAALLGALLVFGDFEPGVWLLPALFLVFALVAAVSGRIGFARWASRRQGQFDALLDQIELVARDAASERGPEAAHLDLDDVPDEPAASETASRVRARP